MPEYQSPETEFLHLNEALTAEIIPPSKAE